MDCIDITIHVLYNFFFLLLAGTRAAVLAFGTKVDILFNLDNETITNAAAASNALNTLQVMNKLGSTIYMYVKKYPYKDGTKISHSFLTLHRAQ